jgi:hypothetical protein
MNRTVAAWLRAIAAFIPSGVGTALSVGAWLALTALFTLVGNAVILGVVTAMGQSLAQALALSSPPGSAPPMASRRGCGGTPCRRDGLPTPACSSA